MKGDWIAGAIYIFTMYNREKSADRQPQRRAARTPTENRAHVSPNFFPLFINKLIKINVLWLRAIVLCALRMPALALNRADMFAKWLIKRFSPPPWWIYWEQKQVTRWNWKSGKRALSGAAECFDKTAVFRRTQLRGRFRAPGPTLSISYINCYMKIVTDTHFYAPIVTCLRHFQTITIKLIAALITFEYLMAISSSSNDRLDNDWINGETSFTASPYDIKFLPSHFRNKMRTSFAALRTLYRISEVAKNT